MLPQYDLFLLPSRTEALPYVILEALQSGLPIIARRVGGVPEILQGISSAVIYDNDNELIDLLKKELPKPIVWNDSRFAIDNMIRKTAFEYHNQIDGKI